MSYVKNTWVTGDTITAEKLNNMENGIASASQGGGGGTGLPEYSYEDENKSLIIEKQIVGHTCGQDIYDYVPAWQYTFPNPDYSDENKILVVKSTTNQETYDTEYKPVWGSAPVPSYNEYDNKKVLTVHAVGGTGGPSNNYLYWDYALPLLDTQGYDDGKILSVCGSTPVWEEPAWEELYGIPDPSYANAGESLVVEYTNGNNEAVWKEIIPDPSSLPGDTILSSSTIDGWGPGWCIPTVGTAVVPGALLYVESTNDKICNWDNILSIINSEAGTPHNGDVLTYRDYSLVWEAPQTSN